MSGSIKEPCNRGGPSQFTHEIVFFFRWKPWPYHVVIELSICQSEENKYNVQIKVRVLMLNVHMLVIKRGTVLGKLYS